LDSGVLDCAKTGYDAGGVSGRREFRLPCEGGDCAGDEWYCHFYNPLMLVTPLVYHTLRDSESPTQGARRGFQALTNHHISRSDSPTSSQYHSSIKAVNSSTQFWYSVASSHVA